MENNPGNMHLLTIRETADRLRISTRTIHRLIATGALNTVKIGRRRLVRETAITALVEG